MTTLEEIKPTQGEFANSFDYILDVAILPAGGLSAILEDDWVNIPDKTNFDPQFADILRDIATDANKGAAAQVKVGETFTTTFNILKIRDLTGEFQPEWLLLKQARDGLGEANQIAIRFYDGKGASDAYAAVASVTRNARPQNGPAEAGWDSFTLTGVGITAPIANPTKTP